MLVAVAMMGPQAAADTRSDELLQRMAESSRATYQARKLVVNLGPPQSAAVLEVRANAGGRYLRAETPQEVTHVWSSRRHGLIADDETAIEDGSPPQIGIDVEAIQRKYEVLVGAPAEFLGVTVVPLTLVRQSDGRLVERLWVHPDYGIPYRREILGPKGDLVGMSTVLEMSWGHAEREDPYDGPRPTEVRASAGSDAPPRLPYGYRLVSSHQMDADGRQADHWVYTDGLHTLSVFRRPGASRPPSDAETVELENTTAWLGPGPATWSWQGGGSAWTLVGDESQLDPVTMTEPFPQGGPSVLSRLGSWWSGAARWAVSRFR